MASSPRSTIEPRSNERRPKLQSKSAHVTLQTFFGLSAPQHNEVFADCLSITTVTNRLAWRGDAMLSNLLSDLLLDREDVSVDVGQLTPLKAKYASNKTMSHFLAHGVLDPHKHPIRCLSEHSQGTVFEALLDTTHRTIGKERAKQCVREYVQWVDKHGPNNMVPSPPVLPARANRNDRSSEKQRPFNLRRYQRRLAVQCCNLNSLVLLPTGAGKTVIASEVIASVRAAKSGLCLFLVPKCLLVRQQAQSIREWLGPSVVVAEFQGGKKMTMTPFDVLVSTPEAFRRAQYRVEGGGGGGEGEGAGGGREKREGREGREGDEGDEGDEGGRKGLSDLSWDRFSLVVFDEVHHMLKKDPYRLIALDLRNFVMRTRALENSSLVPQILGLTASLTYAATEKEVVASVKRLVLELFVRHMATASVEEMARDGYQATRAATEICDPESAENKEFSDCKSALGDTYIADLSGVPRSDRKPHLMLPTFWEQHGNETCSPFATALVKAIRSIEMLCCAADQSFVSPLGNKKIKLAAWGTYAHKKRRRAESHLYELLEHLYEALRLVILGWDDLDSGSMARIYLKMAGICTEENHTAMPLSRTIQQNLFTLFMNQQCGPNFTRLKKKLLETRAQQGVLRVVVFVQQRLETHILAFFVNNDAELAAAGFRAVWIYATLTPAAASFSLSKMEAKSNLQLFKEGKKNILIATATAEEGMDVPSANLTISFDPAQTPVSMTQRKGRARKEDSRNVVLKERLDRSTKMLEEVITMQERIVMQFQRQFQSTVPSHLEIMEKERETQAGLERGAAKLLVGDFDRDNALGTLKNYTDKTQAQLGESVQQSKQKTFSCLLRYSSCLREEVGRAEGSTKKEARKNAALMCIRALACHT